MDNGHRYRELIKSDLFRYYGKCDLITFIRGYLRNRTFRFLCAFRLCNSKGIMKVIGEILWKLSMTKKSNSIAEKHKNRKRTLHWPWRTYCYKFFCCYWR